MKVPPVGESISEVILSSWLKNDGDYVEMDEVIAEMESDKATFELTAEKAGVLHIKAQEGDTVPVGEIVCVIEEGEAPEGAAEEENTPAKEEKEPAGGREAAEKEPSPDNAAKTEASEDTEASGETGASGQAKASGQKTSDDRFPSPAAAKILAEKGIDPLSVNGTGKDGRITKDDALKAKAPDAEDAKKAAPVQAAPAQAAPAARGQQAKTATVHAAGGGAREERRERMSNLRKTISRRLVQVKNDTAMLTTFNEVDMSGIMELRARYKDKFKEKYGVGLGFMSFFSRACCQALKEFPAVNARLDGDELVYNDYVDISIAVSTPRGLVVPVIRNAETLSLNEIEANVIELAVKARDGKLTIEEMTGGTFTITNGGVFGSMLSTPIINAPQSAILGMHNIVERPVVVNKEIVIRPVMFVALSYDHRVIDGKESVSFLVRVKQLLEDPARLLIGV